MANAKEKRRERMRNKARERQTEMSGGKSYLSLPDGVELWTPNNKKNKNQKLQFDFLVYPVTVDGHPDGIPANDGNDSLWTKRPYLVHRDVGPEKKSVICPKSFSEWPEGLPGKTGWLRNIDEACPICEEHLRMADDDNNWQDEDQKTIMKALKPKVRELYNVIPLFEDEPVIKIFDYSWHWFGNPLEQKLDEADAEDDWCLFAEYDGGYTMTVTWRPTDLENKDGDKFLEINPDGINFKSRDDIEGEIIEDIVSLDEVLVRKSYKEIEAIFQGLDSEEEEEEKKEEETKKDKPRKRKAGRKEKPEEKEEKEEAEPIEEAELIEEADVPEGYKLCIACDGTKMNSKGTRPCRICAGKGYAPDEDAEGKEQEEETTKRPTRRRRRR